MGNQELKERITKILPKDSIGRYDLLPIFMDTALFADIVEFLSAPYAGRVDYIAAPEAIGWILGTGVARELKVGFIPLRKADKLPYPKETLISQSYTDYSGKPKTLEIKSGYNGSGKRLLLVDDWVETGATLQCCINLFQKLGCSVIGLATIGIDNRQETKNWIDNDFVTFVGMGM